MRGRVSGRGVWILTDKTVSTLHTQYFGHKSSRAIGELVIVGLQTIGDRGEHEELAGSVREHWIAGAYAQRGVMFAAPAVA